MLTKELLIKVIEGEQNAIAFYEHAKTLTGDSEHLQAIDGIIRDEHKHLGMFEELYRRRFGSKLESPPLLEEAAVTFTGALRRAVGDELDTYELYRNIYLKCSNEQARQAFFEAMTDENEHAIRLNAMYTREVEKRTM